MRKTLALLLSLLLLLSVGVPVFAESTNARMQVIRCPEQGFSVLCDEASVWTYSERDGITVYTEREGGIPYVLIYRAEERIPDVPAYLQQLYTPRIQQKYGENLLSFAEFDSYEIAGRTLPAALYTYRLQDTVIEMLRLFDEQDGHTVVYTAKYVQGHDADTEAALELALKSFRTGADAYDGRWNYSYYESADGNLCYRFEEVQLVLPGSWADRYDIRFNENSVSFYQSASRSLWKENYGFEGGFLFALAYSETKDYETLPSYEDLGQGATGYYFLIYPSDYQAYMDDPDVRNEYDSMFADRQFIAANSSVVEAVG